MYIETNETEVINVVKEKYAKDLGELNNSETLLVIEIEKLVAVLTDMEALAN